MSMKYDHNNISRAKLLRKEMTPWERKLWYCFLRQYQPRFQRQKAIGHYIADFYCAQAKLIIELDGSGHYTETAKAADQFRTHHLEEFGLLVLRYCNADIDKQFFAVCSHIDQIVQQRT